MKSSSALQFAEILLFKGAGEPVLYIETTLRSMPFERVEGRCITFGNFFIMISEIMCYIPLFFSSIEITNRKYVLEQQVRHG